MKLHHHHHFHTLLIRKIDAFFAMWEEYDDEQPKTQNCDTKERSAQ